MLLWDSVNLWGCAAVHGIRPPSRDLGGRMFILHYDFRTRAARANGRRAIES